VSNLETRPGEVAGGCAVASRVEVMTPREVPLGGPRAMTVRRTLPQRGRTTIGAWCFVDHYGPDDVAATGGMKVAPHPHTGLQTVSWLFEGEVEHRDSVGSHATVRPGEINLMTAGRGISHSEVSPPTTTRLHGAQLWVVLPEASRFDEPRFDHYAPEPVVGAGWEARVFLGSLVGSTSPVPTATPLLGAELVLQPGTRMSLDVDPSYEHGILVDHGMVVLGSEGDSVRIDPHALAYVPPARGPLTLTAGDEPARLLLLGGPPFAEKIVMWWNLIGRSHEEVARWRAEWQAQITRDGQLIDDSQDVAPGRFGTVVGDHLRPIPAPPLPNARLRER
jgi:redox-sensitive bicupin YhaK (pirin superfamily)